MRRVAGISKSTESRTQPRVVMVPDYRATNPYQRLIAEGLEALGARIAFERRKPKQFFPLRASVTELGGDVLHLHWITPFLRGSTAPGYLTFGVRLLMDLVFVRASGACVVWTIHNKVSHEARYPGLELWVRRGIAQIVDAMIVHSPEIRREVAADLIKKPSAFHIVPHASFGDLYGVAPDSREARKSLALGANGKIFLNFGIMRPYKGLERLLEAWEASGLAAAGHTLLIAGEFNDPHYHDKILSAARPLGGVRIDEGRVPDDRVRFYFGASDALVLPFERILTSSSLHLAITFEKPVIAPRIPSVAEAMGEADRFLYDPAQTNTLSEALRRCAVADLEAEGTAVRNRRATLMDWHGVAKATLDVYELARKRRLGRRRFNK